MARTCLFCGKCTCFQIDVRTAKSFCFLPFLPNKVLCKTDLSHLREKKTNKQSNGREKKQKNKSWPSSSRMADQKTRNQSFLLDSNTQSDSIDSQNWQKHNTSRQWNNIKMNWIAKTDLWMIKYFMALAVVFALLWFRVHAWFRCFFLTIYVFWSLLSLHQAIILVSYWLVVCWSFFLLSSFCWTAINPYNDHLALVIDLSGVHLSH